MKPIIPIVTTVSSACLALLLSMLVPVCDAQATEPLRYNRDIQPILSDNCFACHGPDKANRKAELRLDQREAALATAESGDAAIVPGDVNKSALVSRIFADDKDDIMPPTTSQKKLTTAQKETLKRWIGEGAKYEMHWAFVSVQPVKVPGAADLPKVDAELLKWPQIRSVHATRFLLDEGVLQQRGRAG